MIIQKKKTASYYLNQIYMPKSKYADRLGYIHVKDWVYKLYKFFNK